MKSDFLIALTQLVAERHLPRDEVLQAVEAALVSAFKRDSVAMGQNISVKLNPASGEMSVYALKTVVEKVDDPRHEISLEEARTIKKDTSLGDEIATLERLPHQASRIAAQTAKQVVLQRLREAEREKVYQEFLGRVEDVVSGVVDQMEPGRVVVLELGRVEGILPPEEQVPTERYRKGQRLKIYVVDVRRGTRGPEIVVSRTHKNLLKRLFELEVPEVYNGVVEIKAIAREPGFRSKVAVFSRQEGVDPVGSCIGMRGNRIQSVVNELQGEKIDIVRWDKDQRIFIRNSLSPAEVSHAEIDNQEQSAVVVVPDRQLSLAIGKEGQNARLAARLVGLRLDIKSVTEWEEIRVQKRAEEQAAREAAAEEAALQETVTEAEEPVEAKVAEPEAAPVAEVEAPVSDNKVEEVPVAEETPVTLEAEEEVQPVQMEVPLVTPEEEVLSEVFGEEEPEEVEEEEEEEAEEELDLFDDSIWQAPAVSPDAGKIRFAEDFADEFRGRGRKGGKKGKRGKSGGRLSSAARHSRENT